MELLENAGLFRAIAGGSEKKQSLFYGSGRWGGLLILG
jgi:hypothetical protein